MVYKWCVVPQCTNTSIKTPEKVFISVPIKRERRKIFLQLARRDPNAIQPHSNVFMCEDHFDMEKDTTNYMKYKMGFSQKIFLTDEAVPTKFHCQEDRKRRLSDAGSSRDVILKRLKIDLVKECLQSQSATETHTESSVKDMVPEIIEPEELPKSEVPTKFHCQEDHKRWLSDAGSSREVILKRLRIDLVKECLQSQSTTETHTESSVKDMVPEIIEPEELPKSQVKETNTDPIISAEKSVPVRVKVHPVHYRSNTVQTICQNRSISTSTSPLKVVVKIAKKKVFFEDEKSESDLSSPFVSTSSSKVTDYSDSYLTDTNENIEPLQCLKNTERLILKNPMLYVGISKKCYFIIQLLHKHTNINKKHILLCLKKIRMNTTFSELEDSFGIALSYGSKLFLANIPIISSFLKQFIVNLDEKLIKKNLPNYNNVSCIIDCLEINIQKPSKAVHQALTWSEYKKRHTLKYLISCTPNGLINFVSQGFGGRTSDMTIVENCNFLDGLQEGSCILADRGFEHLEQAFHERGMKLLRPPSVSAGERLSKTKIIVSMRILMERTIRRVREFHMLKQHLVMNANILSVLDHVIIIASALTNLQEFVIK